MTQTPDSGDRGYRYLNLNDVRVNRAELQAKVDAIKAGVVSYAEKLAQTFPDTTMPPLVLPVIMPNKPGEFGNQRAGMLAHFMIQGGMIASYVEGKEATKHGLEGDAVVLSAEALMATPAHAVIASIGHELGHRFLKKVSQNAAGMSLTDYTAVRRTNECYADHFMVWLQGKEGTATADAFVEGANQGLAALQRGANLSDQEMKTLEEAMWNKGSKHHPPLKERYAMMTRPELLSVRPGTIHFDASCRVIDAPLPTPPNAGQGQSQHRP